MSPFKLLAFTLGIFALAGCATSQEDREEITPAASARLMRHPLRQIVTYDATQMTKLINREINMKERDEDAFYANLTHVLAQTVLVQPHFTERDVAMREFRGKVDEEDFNYLLGKAADELVFVLKKATLPSDQATAIMALKNLVIEIRALRRAELKPVLQKIAEARISVSREAKTYALEPLEDLVSPSNEAQVALTTF